MVVTELKYQQIGCVGGTRYKARRVPDGPNAPPGVITPKHGLLLAAVRATRVQPNLHWIFARISAEG
eukprot:1675171-Rhodomonas_salina.1